MPITERKRGRPAYPDQLTPAEWRVANAVRHGGTNEAIARRLGISRDAVKFHVTSITGKLGLTGRAALRHWPGIPQASALAAPHPQETTMTTSDPFAWGTIGQLSRTVVDIKAAEAWYKDTLRLPHLYTYGPLAFFDLGGTRLMLSAGEGQPQEPDKYVIYLRVPEIHAAYADLQSRGIAFDAAPHMIHRHPDGTEEWMAFFKDNEGRPLAIMAQAKPA
jgi:DNA-binding CsgD family transcriptional regulator